VAGATFSTTASILGEPVVGAAADIVNYVWYLCRSKDINKTKVEKDGERGLQIRDDEEWGWV
jgi:hypothetical protein